MLFNVLIAVGIFFVILIPSSLLSTKLTKKTILSAVVTQIGFIVMSLITTFLCIGSDFTAIGIRPSNGYILLATIFSLIVALPMAYMGEMYGKNYEGPLKVEKTMEFILIFMILAPTAEELVFRGVIETYLILTTTPTIAVTVPAILFAFIHIAPFKNAPKKLMYIIVTSAFLLGVIAGIMRLLSGSLLPAIAAHITFNLSGKIADKIAR
ncbi:MAG: CPBP family intramembrane metalloprotease [Candidatus Odinarchaeota archaeon]|nr:CPBP family intramembrane metalloprotease [Candidatus Odinarchaeota archaeon]